MSNETAFAGKRPIVNGVYNVTLGRETKMHGESMGKAMGVNTWAAGTSSSRVVAGGAPGLARAIVPGVLGGAVS